MSDPPDYHRRWDDIAASIAVAVNQAMTPFRLTLDRLDDDVRQLRTTVYGDPAIRQKGLVEMVGGMNDKLDTIIAQRQQTTWLMRGVVAGLALNLAQVTGLLPAIIKALNP